MIIHHHSTTKSPPTSQNTAPGRHQQSPLPNFPLPGSSTSLRSSPPLARQPDSDINYSDWSDHPSRLPSLHEICDVSFVDPRETMFYSPSSSNYDLPSVLPRLDELPRSQRASSTSRTRRSTSRQRHMSSTRHPRGYSSSTSKLSDLSEANVSRSVLDDPGFTATLELRPAPRGSGKGSRDRSCSAKARRRAIKERRPWSDAETDDLIRAVNKHGIGKWTKIYKDSNFVFNNRSAADLKDRFRTCAPTELLQLYDSRAGGCERLSSAAPNPSMSAPNLSLRPSNGGFPENILNHAAFAYEANSCHSPREPVQVVQHQHQQHQQNQHRQQFQQIQQQQQQQQQQQPPLSQQLQHPSPPQQNRVSFPSDILNQGPPETIKSPSSPTDLDDSGKKRSHRRTMEDILRLGLMGPFKRATRRERRWFTEKEDASILSGLLLYGPQWSRIRNDHQFSCLAERQPTDLRDRVRNKYPELFAALSTKPPRRSTGDSNKEKGGAADGRAAAAGSGSGILDVGITNTIRDLLQQLTSSSESPDSPTSHRTQLSADDGYPKIKQEEGRDSMSASSSSSPDVLKLLEAR